MEPFFNTAGPTMPEDHYHIDPLHRVDWEERFDYKRWTMLTWLALTKLICPSLTGTETFPGMKKSSSARKPIKTEASLSGEHENEFQD